MAKCIAITKKNTQCRNLGHDWHAEGDDSHIILFCNLHHRTKPTKVIIEGTDKIIDYINPQNYLAQVKQNNQNNNDNAAKEKADKEAKINYELSKKQDIWLSIHTCIVCGEEVQNRDTELIKCSSASFEFPHLVCHECLKGHITSLLQDGIANLECMFNKHDHCHGEYFEADIKMTLDNNTNPPPLDKKHIQVHLSAAAATATINLPIVDTISYSKWQEVMAASEIVKLAGVCDNYLICPLCNKWGCIFEIPPGAERLAFIIKCATCARDWCTLCKRASHGGRDCYELAFSEAEAKDQTIATKVIDKMISDIATRALTHCCSVCGCNYVKEEGCNLMTCPKCNGMSCFICGVKLYYKGDRKYWHFTGHDNADPDASCPLWNNRAGDGKANQGNTEFNIAGIGREFWRFISANERQPLIAKLICKRIISMYEKDKAFNDILKNVKRLAIA